MLPEDFVVWRQEEPRAIGRGSCQATATATGHGNDGQSGNGQEEICKQQEIVETESVALTYEYIFLTASLKTAGRAAAHPHLHALSFLTMTKS